jgi:hypothetical protein
VTVAVPVVTPAGRDPVKVTEQLPVADSGHGFVPDMLPEPPLVPEFTTKLTEPVGVLEAVVVSVTVAVQLVVPPGAIVVGGPQVTLVDVLSFPLAKLAV